VTSDRTISVLYIDDDAGLCRLVERYLTRQGYAVETALDGTSGFAKICAGAFDVVAVDHFMPGEDGLALLKRLGELPNPPPAVYVTAADEGRIAIAALKLGAVDYVIKDVQGSFLDLLNRAIRHAIEEGRTQRAKEEAEHDLRESRDRLAELLEQKTALLHEVNHRVANSLQLIVSMISIQAARLSDPAAREALVQARERVQAVMLVHRRLYTSDQIGFIHIDKYLHALAEELQTSMLAADLGHKIEVSAAALVIAPDQAVSVGVVVNELITNALKYAFPTGAAGIIKIIAEQGPDGMAIVTVEDNGVGYAGETPQPKGTGLGSLIIGAMAKTLHGAVAKEPTASGAKMVLSFPLK
jgi:two-component sensor histidine kinase